MAFVYLGLGTNLGNKEVNLNRAIQLINLEIGETLNISSFYRSEPWGYRSENEFLNAVILISSELTPTDILLSVKKIEKKMGRLKKTSHSYQDRIIDIDILLYNNEVILLPDLQIPHPLLHKRDFVLNPLEEIAPDLLHPLLNETITSLNRKLKSGSN